MDKILFEQVPDLFASAGTLFVEKRKNYVKWTRFSATAIWV